MIRESAMEFNCSPENVFHIEKSETYLGLKNVKTVEFLLMRKEGTVWFIEAKTTAPNPESSDGTPFNKFVNEIYRKMENSFLLFHALSIGRHENGLSEMPEQFSSLDLKNADYKFVLVIKTHKKEWLNSLQDKFRQTFYAVGKTWNIKMPMFIAMNEEIARKHSLVK